MSNPLRAFVAKEGPRTFTFKVTFSHREISMLHLLAEGLSHSEIESRIGVSRTSVNNILTGLRQRVGVRTTNELIAWALRNKVIE